MCDWGNTVPVLVSVCAEDSSTGEAVMRVKPIDSCIVDIVRALNAGGVFTKASCCGHGKETGQIILQDGRVLRIVD